ncbi:MAG: hypothetical protein HDR23_05920 [Lachnospiraceae bacterium]|nr:hypothetical protein [Lachnospiraceae bacterium]
MNMTNEWMKDESLKDIEPYKLEFLQALVFESSNLRKEQFLPFFMAVAKRGQEKNISFSDGEINAIIDVLKKHATPEELEKMNKILSMKAQRNVRH